jgi:hypothetical protein
MNTSEKKSKGKTSFAERRLAAVKSNRSDSAGQLICIGTKTCKPDSKAHDSSRCRRGNADVSFSRKKGQPGPANPLCFLAEVHGNRTHLGGYQPPTLDLKGENAKF